jgi:hypothetical protein
MQTPPLLTQDELDFIQHLSSRTQQRDAAPEPATGLQVDAGWQVTELLAHCAANEQLTIQAHFADQRLTFTPQLSEDANHGQHLALGTPQIFEQGSTERPWRLPLEPPLALCDTQGNSSGLWVHELSLNGALVELREAAIEAAPRRFTLALQLGEQQQVGVQGYLIRKAIGGRVAYRLVPLDAPAREQLQQFIYQQHRRRYPQAHHR